MKNGFITRIQNEKTHDFQYFNLNGISRKICVGLDLFINCGNLEKLFLYYTRVSNCFVWIMHYNSKDFS